MAMKPIELLIKAKDETAGILGSIQGKLTAIGAAVAAYFGVSAFVGAVKGAAELEAKLSEVKAVSGATAAEMVQLRQAAEAAGASTKFTATEAADALGNLSRSGLSAKDSIAALPAVLNLAQAGGIGLGQASEYLTTTVMGLGLAFTDSGRVADVLAKGANAANSSVTTLAQGMSYAAPIANNLGLGLEFTVALLGKFEDAGIKGTRAGTALNAILAQFSDPASKFRQELLAAGITTGNFEKALHQLAAAGPAGQRAILAVGTEAGPALQGAINLGMAALDGLKGKLNDAGGSAAAAAAVMEDNLKGSFNSLSSAWDTVKNTLATPVLPVIRDGVTSLSAALTAAVSSGAVARFGESIATAFQNGIKWAKAFSETVDVDALIARFQKFAGEAQQSFIAVGEYARNAGNIVQTAYGVMSAGANSVMMVINGFGVALSGILAKIQFGLAALYDGMSKVTFGDISARYKQMAAEVRLSAEATTAASLAFADKTIESFVAVGDGAKIARDGWSALTKDTGGAATQAATSQQVFKSVSETLKEVGGDATAAGQKAQAAGILQKEAAQATRTAVAALKTEYEAALAAGDVQLAVQKLQAMQKELQATGAEAKKMAAAIAKETADAFTGLGITSQASMKSAAASANVLYERIKADSSSTAVDVANAWQAMAEKAIAANNGVATDTLKSQAAMHGLEIQVDSAGKAIVRAMGEGASAASGLGEAFKLTTEQIRAQEDAMDRIAMRYKLSSDYTERQIALLEREAAAIEKAAEAERKRLAIDKEGYSVDKNGNRINQQIETRASVAGTLTGMGVSDTQAKAMAAQLVDSLGNINLKAAGSYQEGDSLSSVLKKLADNYRVSAASEAERKAAQAEREKLPDAVAKSDAKSQLDATNQQAVKAVYAAEFLASPEGMRMAAQLAQAQAIIRLAGTKPTPESTVNVRITLPTGVTKTVPTTQAGYSDLMAVLQASKLAAGY